MVDVPTPTMVIVEPLTVATDVLLLMYVKDPTLLLLGALIVKGMSPYVLLIAPEVPRAPRDGTAPATVNVELMEPEV